MPLCYTCFPRSNGKKVYHKFILPPLPLMTNSAEHLWSALAKHPMMADLQKAKQRLLKHSRLALDIHEVDGHLANEKLHRMLSRHWDDGKLLTDFVLCRTLSDKIRTSKQQAHCSARVIS